MTEDEAIEYMRLTNHWLFELPKEFHTKEFVLELMNEYRVHLTFYEITQCVLIDYDIALAWCVRNNPDNINLRLIGIQKMLSDDEYKKLIVALKLMK